MIWFDLIIDNDISL